MCTRVYVLEWSWLFCLLKILEPLHIHIRVAITKKKKEKEKKKKKERNNKC